MAALVASPHDITLPTFVKDQTVITEKETVEPDTIARKWLTTFETSLGSKDVNSLSALIVEDG